MCMIIKESVNNKLLKEELFFFFLSGSGVTVGGKRPNLSELIWQDDYFRMISFNGSLF